MVGEATPPKGTPSAADGTVAGNGAHDATTSYEAYISRPSGSNEASSSTSIGSSTSAMTGQSGSRPAAKNSRRLYVGNLHPAVDEYLLVNTFKKYGKLVKVDFLFHKTGEMKGKPRGYAFVEFERPEEALHALTATNDRTLRGRKLSVTFANVKDQPEGGFGPHRHNRDQSDALRPTTLSLIKGASQPKGVDAKIAAMEAKLAAIQSKTSGQSASTSEASTSKPQPSTTAGRSAASMPGYASLPRKPPAPSLPPKR